MTEIALAIEVYVRLETAIYALETAYGSLLKLAHPFLAEQLLDAHRKAEAVKHALQQYYAIPETRK